PLPPTWKESITILAANTLDCKVRPNDPVNGCNLTAGPAKAYSSATGNLFASLARPLFGARTGVDLQARQVGDEIAEFSDRDQIGEAQWHRRQTFFAGDDRVFFNAMVDAIGGDDLHP